MKSLLLYDLETSGIHPVFSQILQYASLRLDENGRVLVECEYQLRLNPDTWPDPEALWVHGIDPFVNKGEDEYQQIRRIHAAHTQANTCSGGYNTMGFDEEFLRFSFFRNLLDPYQHQYANGCARFDLYALLPFYYLFDPGILSWPEVGGKVSMKLEDLNDRNAWLSGQAHDAMHDVRVTAHLLKLLRSNVAIWDYLWGFFDQGIDRARLADYPTLKIAKQSLPMGLIVSGLYRQQGFLRPALFLGHHQQFAKQGFWLLLDEPLSGPVTQGVVKKKWAEPPFALPAKARFLQHLYPEAQSIFEENLKFLQENPECLPALQSLSASYQPLPDIDLDASLYQGGFFTTAEKQWCQQFHQLSSWQDRYDSLCQAPSSRIHAQASRLLLRHGGSDWPLAESAKLQERGCDYKGQYRTSVLQLIERTEAICASSADHPHAPLLRSYLERLRQAQETAIP